MFSCRRVQVRLRQLRLRQRGLSTSNGLHNVTKSVPKRGRVIFSGIQPTGIPHVSNTKGWYQLSDEDQLGNYLGALSNWVKLQRNADPEDELFFSIVGWHALTLPQNSKELSVSRVNMLATLLAIGIDPKRSVVFHQDDVSNIQCPLF